MDVKTVATLVGCIVTVAGALAFLSRSTSQTAARASEQTLNLIRELAVNHMRNVESKLDTLADATKETTEAIRETTAVVAQLVDRLEPPPAGGVVTNTSEDVTPPLGLIRPDGTRAPAGRYQFKRKEK